MVPYPSHTPIPIPLDIPHILVNYIHHQLPPHIPDTAPLLRYPHLPRNIPHLHHLALPHNIVLPPQRNSSLLHYNNTTILYLGDPVDLH